MREAIQQMTLYEQGCSCRYPCTPRRSCGCEHAKQFRAKRLDFSYNLDWADQFPSGRSNISGGCSKSETSNDAMDPMLSLDIFIGKGEKDSSGRVR